jgi:uncharacterized phiE125 gp8 family phage protein
MSTGIIAQPNAEPVTLAEVKARLRMTATADDALISSLIPTARTFAEKICGYSLASKAYTYSTRGFPWPHISIRLPVPPVSAVTSVTYLDCEGNIQTWDPSEYMIGLTQIPAVIRPRPGFIYPETLHEPDIDAVFIQFQAGPATGALGLDFSTIYEAIRQLTIHFYTHPEAVNSEDLKEMPLGIQANLTPRYRPIH